MENENLKGRYGAVIVAWYAGILVLPAAAAFVLFQAADARCDTGMTDCSWGFEVLLILPVLAVSLVTMGPLAVRLVLGRLHDPLAGSTARWVLLMALASLPAFFVIRGLAFLLAPIGGRYVALRRARHKPPASIGNGDSRSQS